MQSPGLLQEFWGCRWTDCSRCKAKTITSRWTLHRLGVAQPHGPVQREQRQQQCKCAVNKAAGRSGRYWGSDMLAVSQRVHEPGSSGLCSTAVTTHTHGSAEAFEPGQGSQHNCCSQCPRAESNTKIWVFLALHHGTGQPGLLHTAAQQPATSRHSRPILSKNIPHLCCPFYWKFL